MAPQSKSRNTRVDDDDEEDETLDLEKIAKDAQRRTAVWRPKDGRNPLRILYLKSERSFYRKVHQHFGLGPNNRTVFCLAEMGQGKCPACEYWRKLRQSRDPRDQEAAKEYRPKEQYMSAVVPLGDDTPSVRVFFYGTMIYQQLAEIADELQPENPFSRKTGRKFSISRIQKGKERMQVQYTVRIGPNPEPLDDPEWADQAEDVLDAALVFESAEAIRKMLDADDEEDEEEEERPRKAQVAPGRTRPALAAPAKHRAKDADEEDEEEEEEETKPAPRRARDEDEDEEDEPLDLDPDEDEPPAKKPRKAPSGEATSATVSRLKSRLDKIRAGTPARR